MKVSEAVERLWDARLGGARSPSVLVGALNLAQAYEVQQRIAERIVDAGDRISGWKIGGNSAGFRGNYGGHPPLRGFLFASTQHASGATCAYDGFPARPKLESELCFFIGKRLAGHGVTREEVTAAISAVAPAFEIPFLKLESLAAGKMDLPLCIAENANNLAYVTGAPIEPYPVGLDLGAIHVDERRNGVTSQQGRALDFIDHQFDSIAWLAANLADHGLAIEPGHCIMSGNCCPVPADPRNGDVWETTFTNIGSVSVAFA